MRTRLLALTAASCVLAGLFLAPASSAESLYPLTQPACSQALTALGKAQSKAMAPTAVLDAASLRCQDDSLSFPRARFATVTVGKNTVGAVFAQTGDKTLSAPNLLNTTSLLLNGHTSDKYKPSDEFFIENAQALVSISGQQYTALVTASLGDGGQDISLTLESPLGLYSPSLASAAINTPPRGAKVTVYTDAGPKFTTIGPVYAKKFASLNKAAFGTVTTREGTFIGTAGSFGTGYSSNKEWKFWSDRAYFVPFDTKAP